MFHFQSLWRYRHHQPCPLPHFQLVRPWSIVNNLWLLHLVFSVKVRFKPNPPKPPGWNVAKVARSLTLLLPPSTTLSLVSIIQLDKNLKSSLDPQARQTSGFTWREVWGRSTTPCFIGCLLPSPSCKSQYFQRISQMNNKMVTQDFVFLSFQILSFFNENLFHSVFLSPPTPPLPSSCPTRTQHAGGQSLEYLFLASNLLSFCSAWSRGPQLTIWQTTLQLPGSSFLSLPSGIG